VAIFTCGDMPILAQIDWQKLLVPEQPALDSVIRGTIVYLLLFVIMRFLLKRRSGGLGMADVLVVVLIADAVQNAMGSEYRSVTEGALLVLTIVFWDRALDWLGDRFPRLRRFTRPPPLLLIEDGRLLHHNMRHEMITIEELLSELRQQGVDNPTDVKCAFMEGNGELSVLRRDR
jgi:uncharacterized membrane protein YcaP (DUF421 family)